MGLIVIRHVQVDVMVVTGSLANVRRASKDLLVQTVTSCVAKTARTFFVIETMGSALNVALDDTVTSVRKTAVPIVSMVTVHKMDLVPLDVNRDGKEQHVRIQLV